MTDTAKAEAKPEECFDCDGGGCGWPCSKCGAEYGGVCENSGDTRQCPDGERRCVCHEPKKETPPVPTKPIDLAPDASKHWVQSYMHGLAVEPFNLKPDQIQIADIAHALHNLCRYTGHVREFYSVATHSIAVMRLAELNGLPKRVQLWALLHDAGEAYLSDIAAPLKRHPIFEGYRRLEAEIDIKLRERFDVHVTSEELALVRTLDYSMILPEKSALLRPKDARPWDPIPVEQNAEAAFTSARALPGAADAWYLYHFHRLTGHSSGLV